MCVRSHTLVSIWVWFQTLTDHVFALAQGRAPTTVAVWLYRESGRPTRNGSRRNRGEFQAASEVGLVLARRANLLITSGGCGTTFKVRGQKKVPSPGWRRHFEQGAFLLQQPTLRGLPTHQQELISDPALIGPQRRIITHEYNVHLGQCTIQGSAAQAGDIEHDKTAFLHHRKQRRKLRA